MTMENLLIVLIALSAIGFGVAIFFQTKLLKEQRQTNENLIANNKSLSDIKTQLDKLETVGKENKAVSKEGFAQIENALKETIKLD